MRITEDAIQNAISCSRAVQQDLLNNYNFMNRTIDPYLQEWKDANVERFLEIQSLFDSYVKCTSSNIDRIIETLQTYLNFMHQYNG